MSLQQKKFPKPGERGLFKIANMKNYPSVSIVFPNHNGGVEPLECLLSIYNLDYPKRNVEVIVVDNNSTDGSLEQFKVQGSRFARIAARRAARRAKFKVSGRRLKIIENKENVGFAKAINQGINSSHGEFIFITNDDIIFDKDSLRMLVEHLVTHPKVGIVGGKIFSKNKPSKVISCGYMMNKWTGNVYPSPSSDKVHTPDWIQGCAMLVLRKVIDKIGLLDEGFSLIYFEDFDFCLRAKKAGYPIVYIPSAHFWHGQSITMDKDLPHKYYQWYKNKLRFIAKNLPPLNILSMLLMQFALITPFRALVLGDRRFVPFLKGLFWNIIHLPQTLEARRNMV